jgi:hypothetical protein
MEPLGPDKQEVTWGTLTLPDKIIHRWGGIVKVMVEPMG